MQRVWWPGFEMQLLGELQRQQNSGQFCDTLLQTDGISVPAHSCILAALSPYLSQRLSSSPSPSLGQRRLLNLQSVKAQTLLKLVGLLYSGELGVKGSTEHNDVLSAACGFGITNLAEGQKEVGTKAGEHQKSCGRCRETNERIKMQDAQVQAELARGKATDCAVGKTSSVSTGTQTAIAGERMLGRAVNGSGQTKHSTQQSPFPVAQSLDCFITVPPQSITPDNHLDPTHSSLTPNIPKGAQGSGKPSLDLSSDIVTNSMTASWFNNTMTCPTSLYHDSSSQENGIRLEDEQTNLKAADSRKNAKQPNCSSRDEVQREEKGGSAKKKYPHVGRKSLARMKRQMFDTAQISIKVKLVRTEGEVWEVVNMRDTGETSSVFTSVKQTDLTNGELFSVQPGSVHPAAVDSPEPPPPPPPPPPAPLSPIKTTSDCQLFCSECSSPNWSNELESAALGQPPGVAEESDEQIEKLLEDIMMGLNILPDLERDCKSPRHHQLSQEGAPTVCHDTVSENERAQSEMHAVNSAAGYEYCEDFSPKNPAQNQPSCSSLSSVQPHAPQCHSSLTSTEETDGTSHQDAPPSESLTCPYPAAPAPRSVIPADLGPTCEDPSSRDVLELFPLKNGNEVQSSPPFSVPCADDLRLPQCLSPLEPFISASKPNNSLNHGGNFQSQPSFHGRPKLTESPGSLQFPLSGITQRESTPLAQDKSDSCQSRQQQTRLELNMPPCRRPRVKSDILDQGGTVAACHQNATEGTSERRKMTAGLRCKQGDAAGNAAAPGRRKRKRSGRLQDGAASRLALKDEKPDDGTKGQIILGVCSVSLSSNNVLAKEREMASNSSHVANKFLKQSTVTKSGTQDLKTVQTRIRTRAHLSQTSVTSRENVSVLKPPAHTAKTMNKHRCPAPRLKCGGLETKLGESPAAYGEKKSQTEPSEQPTDNSLLKGEAGEEKRCKKRGRSRREVEVIPLKKAMNAGKAEADDKNDAIPAMRTETVNLKEFQELIKCQHSKTKEREETGKDVTEPQIGSHVIFDKNQNQISKKLTPEDSESQQDKDNTHVTTGEETSLSQTSLSYDVLGEQAQPAAGWEEPLQNPEAAEKTCEVGVACTTWQPAISDEGLSHSDTHTLTRGDTKSLAHKSNPQEPEKIGASLSDTVVFIENTGDDQEKEEVEVELDVLDYSPVLQSRVIENRLDNMGRSLEEEEEEEGEEDVNVIDVTGDEAE